MKPFPPVTHPSTARWGYSSHSRLPWRPWLKSGIKISWSLLLNWWASFVLALAFSSWRFWKCSSSRHGPAGSGGSSSKRVLSLRSWRCRGEEGGLSRRVEIVVASMRKGHPIQTQQKVTWKQQSQPPTMARCAEQTGQQEGWLIGLGFLFLAWNSYSSRAPNLHFWSSLLRRLYTQSQRYTMTDWKE